MREMTNSIDVDDITDEYLLPQVRVWIESADWLRVPIMLISLADLPRVKSHVARIVTRVQLFPSTLHVSR